MRKVDDICKMAINRGLELPQDILEKIREDFCKECEYKTEGKLADEAIDNIYFNIMQKIQVDKKRLYEKYFNKDVPEEDVIKMKALEYLEDNLSEIIKQYKK